MYGFFKSNKYPVNIRRQISPFYCGVCKSIEQFFGFRGRMFASYDAAMPLYFLYLSEKKNYVEKPATCYFRVINPVNIIGPENLDSYFLAAVTLLYMKLSLDDKKIDNEFGFFHGLLEKFSDVAVKKALDYLEKNKFDLSEYDKLIKSQSQLEKKSENLDFEKASFYTEKAFEKVYKALYDDESWSFIGRLHGRMVYLWDAVMDIKKDVRCKSFNPLINYNVHSIQELFNDNFDEMEKNLLEFITERNKPELSEFFEFNRIEKNKKMEKWLKQIKKYLK
ncbi:hypothetical protein KAJ27_22225 [bacterium]|nr:hypothetical protein [bacterium]